MDTIQCLSLAIYYEKNPPVSHIYKPKVINKQNSLLGLEIATSSSTHSSWSINECLVIQLIINIYAKRKRYRS